MLLDQLHPSRIQAFRANPETLDPIIDPVSGSTPGGGRTDGGSASPPPTDRRGSQGGNLNAQRRIDKKEQRRAEFEALRTRAENAEKSLREVNTWKASVQPKLDRVERLLFALDGRKDPPPDPYENLDLLDQDGMKALLRDRDRAHREELAALRTEMLTARTPERPEAVSQKVRQDIANERIRAVEEEFAAERGLQINPTDPNEWIESDEEGAWTGQRWAEFISFMSRKGFRPSGRMGEYTMQDYQDAELLFDREGVLRREGQRREEELLKQMEDPLDRNGRTRYVGPKVDLNKEVNPFKDDNEYAEWLSNPRRTEAEALKMKRLLRKVDPRFLDDFEAEVIRINREPDRGGGFTA